MANCVQINRKRYKRYLWDSTCNDVPRTTEWRMKTKRVDEKIKAPSEGWSSHDGRVLLISDKQIGLRKEENKYWTEKDNSDSDISKSPSSLNEINHALFNEESAPKKIKMQDCNSENKLKQKREDYVAKSFDKRILSSTSSNSCNENEMDSGHLNRMPWFSQTQTVSTVLKPPNTARLMTSSSCSKCQVLASTIQKYRDEIAAMTMQAEEHARFKIEYERMKQIVAKLNDDLPKMFGFMQQSLTSALSQSSSECLDDESPISSPQIASFAASAATLNRSMNKPSANHQKNQQFIVNSSSPSSVMQNVTGVQQDEFDLGFGVTVSKTKLSMIKSTRPTHLARLLMDLIFTQEEMRQSSVTGRAGNPLKVAKQALDSSKVSALLSYVLKQYPGTGNRLIKQTMAEKLKEVGRKFGKQQIKGNL